MYISLKVYKKMFTFLLFRNLEQMSLSGDTGGRYWLCSKEKEIFQFNVWVCSLIEEEFIFTVRYKYHSTEIRHFF